MPEEDNYDWAGVWVLASIHRAEEAKDQDVPKSYKKMVFSERVTKYKNLYQIVAEGDLINHAIFNDDELLDGIKRLLKAGFIEEIDDYLLTTNKLKKLFKEATRKKKYVGIKTTLRIFAKILKTKLPWE